MPFDGYVAPRIWWVCDNCKKKVRVGRASHWQRARPHCPHCGGTRFITPEDAKKEKEDRDEAQA